MMTHFFPPASTGHNLQVLSTRSILHFYQALPAFNQLLSALQAKGWFLDKTPVDYGVKDALANLNQEALKTIPTKLLASKLDLEAKPETDVSDKISRYAALICDVLKNQLAMQNYEPGLPDRENVSEREHALQAGKISYLIGMPMPCVLSLLTHDVGRTINPSEMDAHANHHLVGSDLVAPMHFDVDFSWYHGFAKYLLFVFCEPYKSLISPVSMTSLAIQLKTFAPQIAALEKLPSEAIAPLIYRIMLMRLIDDSSKVPVLEVKKLLQAGEEPAYFTDSLIKDLIGQQCQCAAKIDEDFEKKLDKSLEMLSGAKAYSLSPHLYQSSPIRCRL